MYLEIFPADFAVFRVFLGISRDFAEIPEFRGSATARYIRSPAKLTLNTKTNHVKSNRRDMDLHWWLQAVQGGMD